MSKVWPPLRDREPEETGRKEVRTICGLCTRFHVGTLLEGRRWWRAHMQIAHPDAPRERTVPRRRRRRGLA